MHTPSERFSAPIDSPQIVTPLEDFRDQLHQMFDGLEYGHISESDNEPFVTRAKYPVNSSVPSHIPVPAVEARVWVPSADTNPEDKSGEPLLMLVLRASKTISTKWATTFLEKERSLNLDFSLDEDSTDNSVFIEAAREPAFIQNIVFNNGNYKDPRRPVHTTFIESPTELRQRVRWAAGKIGKMVAGDEDPSKLV